MLIKLVLLQKFFRMESFSSFKISKQLQYAIEDLGYENPTPIQSQSFPVIQSGKDMVGIAQTGTGKTFAYMLPILQEQVRVKHLRICYRYCKLSLFQINYNQEYW